MSILSLMLFNVNSAWPLFIVCIYDFKLQSTLGSTHSHHHNDILSISRSINEHNFALERIISFLNVFQHEVYSIKQSNNYIISLLFMVSFQSLPFYVFSREKKRFITINRFNFSFFAFQVEKLCDEHQSFQIWITWNLNRIYIRIDNNEYWIVLKCEQ